MLLQSPDHLAFQMWLASPKETRWLRDFCVIQGCFVVLLGEFATDTPRAWLLRQLLAIIKISDFSAPSSLLLGSRDSMASIGANAL